MMKNFLPLITLFFLSSCASTNYSKWESSYAQEKYQEIPDYSLLQYWAAHPQKKDPSDSVPAPLRASYQPNNNVDIFFVHPTTYTDSTKPFGWTASLNDYKTNLKTDYTTILKDRKSTRLNSSHT